VNADQSIICDYKENEWHKWPKHLVCSTSNANFNDTARNDKFSFSGTSEQKLATKTLNFMFQKTAIDFLPTDVLTEFPHLKGLILAWAHWPIIKSLVLNSHFRRIQHLYLDPCKITRIADNAFAELTELRWITIWNNHISYLKRETFQHNLKFEYLMLGGNRIKMINSRFFDNLNSLKEIHFRGNASLVKPCNRNDITRTFQKCIVISWNFY
jgi:hypothetical protein